MTRLKRQRPEPTVAARLPDGAFARAIATNHGPGGFIRHGDVVTVDHPNLAGRPDCFELVWRPTPESFSALVRERDEEVNDAQAV